MQINHFTQMKAQQPAEIKVQRLAYIFCQTTDETKNSLKNAREMRDFLRTNAGFEESEIWFDKHTIMQDEQNGHCMASAVYHSLMSPSNELGESVFTMAKAVS